MLNASSDCKFVSQISSRVMFPKAIVEGKSPYNNQVVRRIDNSDLIKRMKEREKASKCFSCGKMQRKYVCTISKRVACSYECFQNNKLKK